MKNEADNQTLDLIAHIDAQPIIQNARAREAVGDLGNALNDCQRFKANDEEVKQHKAILTFGNPKLNDYLIAGIGIEVNRVDVSNRLVLAAFDLDGSLCNVAYIEPNQPTVFAYQNHDKRGFYSFNNPAQNGFAYVVIDIVAAFKISAAGLPCILIAPITAQYGAPVHLSAAYEYQLKATIKAITQGGLKTYCPVACHEKNDYARALSGVQAGVLALEAGIGVYDDVDRLKKYLSQLKTQSESYVLSCSDTDKTLPDDQGGEIEAAIQMLAGLSTVLYEQCRQDEAKRLGIRASVLDKLIKAARAELEANTASNDLFSKVQPWHEPVDGAALLQQIRTVIERHIVCEPFTTTAAALWIMFSWCIDAVQIAPIACITAPEKRCGKTQLLTLIGELCYRPLPVSNITAAAAFRAIDEWQPTLLVDEYDSFIKDNEDLRGIFNAGHSRKNAYVIRTVGDDHKPTRFNVWSAKALSGIGHLPETLKDRSIILELRRKQPHETRQRLRHANPLEFEQIKSKLMKWAQDHFEQIQQARPELPDCLNDRAQDNWEALLIIADLIGGDWPKKARHAAITISGVEQNSPSINEELLGDIKVVFDRTGQPKIFSEDLLEHLCGDDELNWVTWNRGRPMTPRQLSTRLTEFGIKSKNVRIGSSQKKGYELIDFKDAFTRYLVNNPVSPVPTSHANNINTSSEILSVPLSEVGTHGSTLKSLQHKACNAGTDKIITRGVI